MRINSLTPLDLSLKLPDSENEQPSPLAYSSDTQHSELTTLNTEPASPLAYSSDTQHSELGSSSLQEDVLNDSSASDNLGLQPVPSAVPAVAVASDPTLPAMQAGPTPSEDGQTNASHAVAPPPLLQQDIQADLADLQALRLQVRTSMLGYRFRFTSRPHIHIMMR